MANYLPTSSQVRHAVARWPVRWYFVLAVTTELLVMTILVAYGADAHISEALGVANLPFKTDYLSASRLGWIVPSVLPSLLLVVLQPLTPTIAAFTVTAVAWQRTGLKELIARYRPWRSDVDWTHGLRTWALCIGTFVFMSLATAALNRLLLSGDEFSWNQDSRIVGWIPAFLIAMFLDGGGVGEETGWRGFAQPLLQRSQGPFVGTLCLGLLWSLWHIPAKPDLLLNGPSHFAFGFGVLTIRLLALSMIMAYFFNRVGGSTLIAIAMHGLHNDSVGLQGKLLSESDHLVFLSEITLLVPIVTVSALIVVGTKGRLGDRGCLGFCSARK